MEGYEPDAIQEGPSIPEDQYVIGYVPKTIQAL